MPVFSLRPIDPNHPSWTHSTRDGPCLVWAADEISARASAASHFREVHVSSGSRPAPDPHMNPWLNPDVVSCNEMAEISGTPQEYGTVVIPDK